MFELVMRWKQSMLRVRRLSSYTLKLKNSPPGDCFEGYSALFVRDGTNTPSRRPEHDVSSCNHFWDFHS